MAQPKDDELPVFSTREVQFRKARDANKLLFSVPAHSSLLLPVLKPKCHAYEERDRRWLHLLQAVAVVPSLKTETIQKLMQQALQLTKTLPPVWSKRAEQSLRPLVDALAKADDEHFSTRAVLALKIKEQVAVFLREWIADPIEGFVLRKEHVVGGMRLDDVVATPVGAGYLRGFRAEDGFCIVLFPWGYGYVHVKCVDEVEHAIEMQHKKRRFNEFMALEHQHMYEEIESLVENYPADIPAGATSASIAANVVTPDGINVAEYTKLLTSLQEEEVGLAVLVHFDPQVVQKDLSFVRRVQELSKKTNSLRNHTGHEDEEEEGDRDEAAMEGEEEKTAAAPVTAPVLTVAAWDRAVVRGGHASAQLLRAFARRYKELAIRVHPDKNKSPDAEEAFKRLSEAYECLVEEQAQRAYLHKLTAKPMPSWPSRPAPPVPPRYRKRKQPPPPPAPPSRPPAKRRCRTPEEIWEAFQREEEALARKEFHARGFDRSYESSSAPKESQSVESPPEDVAKETQEHILNSNLNEKAQRWSAWSRSTSSFTGSSVESTTSTSPDFPEVPQANTEAPAVICCMLCRRKFPTTAALVRHETYSPLHLANLAK